ncbi:O-Methyltransferase involved in polyketide biosynthesis [Saccharopolyspora shandongensis]|uniref:O-Methyltransferase involved in polyketide biosynthesis n=1 Tax=Saccharopolyspora shandongensis TaxID=418495 RepID=A0A1H3SPK9_9PSEU|nr:SAM-dependent methyltransferase [Saccharopolyspora shandongensis]SDZ39608.1 O-Methyltransferase involved in polyketide biosynthesis [Saccharopolyspora shandongensis]
MSETPPSPEIDTSVPSVARAYDYFLGGKDNFEVDRAVLRQAMEVLPEARLLAIENRHWLTRVIRFLTREAGITQFLDVGSGLPTRENTHQVARRIERETSVVYVDNDPACLAYGRALLEENGLTHFVSADLTKPDELLSNPAVRQHIDFDTPLALIQCGTIHHVPNELRPHEIMRTYIEALPSGSYLALTHFFNPQDENGYYADLARRTEQSFHDANLGSGFWRTREEIQSYFDGLEMVEPGLVYLHDWWPDGPRLRPVTDAEHLIVGGVGRKP